MSTIDASPIVATNTEYVVDKDERLAILVT